jgi:hypothetical protein
MTNEFRGTWTIDCMITKFDSTSLRLRGDHVFAPRQHHTTERNHVQLRDDVAMTAKAS